jgi:hypothetical protein
MTNCIQTLPGRRKGTGVVSPVPFLLPDQSLALTKREQLLINVTQRVRYHRYRLIPHN